jgi:hypothetical protein
VNSFTLNGVDVKNLADPIVLTLPLPSSTRRRRLSEWNGTWPKKDTAASYSIVSYLPTNLVTRESCMAISALMVLSFE